MEHERNRPDDGFSPIGPNIRQARRSAGLTQTDLADALGIALRTVQHWESNRNAPSWKHMHALAARFGKAPSWFLVEHSEDTEHRRRATDREPNGPVAA